MNLLQACVAGDDKTVQTILSKRKTGPEINQHDNHGWTPLHHAVHENHVNCVRLLLKHPSTIRNYKNYEGETPLFLGCSKADIDIEIINLLINADSPTIEHCNNECVPPLHRAVANKRLDVIKVLVESKADINAIDLDGDNCLHIALYDNPPDPTVVAYLISRHELDTTKKNDAGLNPLAYGCYHVQNEDLKIKLIDKLLPRENTVSFCQPLDVLEPAFFCICHSMHHDSYPFKVCNFLLQQSTHLDATKNRKYSLLKFFLENFTANAMKADPHPRLMYQKNEYIIFFLQFALHHELWPTMWPVLELFVKVTNNYFPKNDMLDRIFYLIMRSACDSDQHLEFAIQFYSDFIQVMGRVHQYFGAQLTHVLRWWLLEAPDIRKRRRAGKLLEYLRSIGMDMEEIIFDVMHDYRSYFRNSEWHSNNLSNMQITAIQLIAPHYAKFWLDFRNFDCIIGDNLVTLAALQLIQQHIHEKDFGRSNWKKKRSTANVTLKRLCRQCVLEMHRNNLDNYYEYVSQLELPRELKDFLSFRLSDSDLVNMLT